MPMSELSLPQSGQIGFKESQHMATNSLAAKVSTILGEIHRLPKSGHNSFQNYRYATEADVLDMIRPLLSAQGIAIFCDVLEVQDLDNCRVRVRVQITMVDSESGETQPSIMYGEARDADKNGRPLDKGIYKAVTGATKYWAFKTFLISTGDDQETQEDAHKERQSRPKAKANARDDVVSEAQLKRYFAFANENGWSLEAQKALLSGYGISSRRQIPISLYEEIIAVLANPEAKRSIEATMGDENDA